MLPQTQMSAIPHPLIDESGDGWVASFTDRSIVRASVARTGFLVEANRAGVVPVIATEQLSRLTWPMLQLVSEFGALWLARGSDGTFVNGLTGSTSTSINEAVKCRRSPVERTPHLPGRFPGDEPGFDAGHVVQLTLIVNHPARADTVLGGVLNEVAVALTGNEVEYWGDTEPLAGRWSEAAVTASIRNRMPETVRYLAAGGSATNRLSATVRVARTEHGVSEELRVLAFVRREVDVSRAVQTMFERLASEKRVVFGSAFRISGRRDLTFGAEESSPPSPISVLVGPRAVRETGADLTELETGVGAVRLGRPRTPSALLTFDTEPEVAWAQLHQAAAGFDPALLAAAMGYGVPHAS